MLLLKSDRTAPKSGLCAGKTSVKPENRGYTARPAMAVPKRRQTSARRDQRRATHRLKAPRVNECPVCHQPKRPHHVCPTCKTYRGREVEPLRAPAP